jgi:hypothetical protein
MYLRRLTALLMVCAYLILPLDSFADLEPSPGGTRSPAGAFLTGDSSAAHLAAYRRSPSSPSSPSAATSQPAAESPAGQQAPAVSKGSHPHCPCSDSHPAGDCDTSCSCCSCGSYLAPDPQELVWGNQEPDRCYLTVEPFQALPEVFYSIFVPPQNLS